MRIDVAPRPAKRVGFVLLSFAAVVALVLVLMVVLMPESEGGFEARFILFPVLAVGGLSALALFLGGGAFVLGASPPGPVAPGPAPPLAVLTVDREER